GVVDQAVDLAVGVDGGVEQGLGTGHRPDVVRPGHRLPAGRHDLVDDGLGDGRVGPRAVGLAADVVHDHPAALGGDAAGVLAAETAAGPGDDDHPSVQRTHHTLPI